MPIDSNALRDRVEEEITNLIDLDMWNLAKKTEEAEKASMKSVIAQWKKCLGKGDK